MNKIQAFQTHLPSILWVTVMKDASDITVILNSFIILSTKDFLKQVVNDEIEEHFDGLTGSEDAETFPVIDKKSGRLGVLVVIYNIDNITSSTVPHEAVHVADYYYEYTNQHGENFSEGNEGYAYLVGWAASNIFNVIKEYKQYG